MVSNILNIILMSVVATNNKTLTNKICNIQEIMIEMVEVSITSKLVQEMALIKAHILSVLVMMESEETQDMAAVML